MNALQGVLSWVGQPKPGQPPPSFEVRLYDVLFKSPEPASLGDAWLQDLSPDSEVVLRGALASPPLAAAKIGDRWVPLCRPYRLRKLCSLVVFQPALRHAENACTFGRCL